MEKFEITVGIIWFASLLFLPALLIMLIWGVDVHLLKQMFFTDVIVLLVFSFLMQVVNGID